MQRRQCVADETAPTVGANNTRRCRRQSKLSRSIEKIDLAAGIAERLVSERGDRSLFVGRFVSARRGRLDRRARCGRSRRDDGRVRVMAPSCDCDMCAVRWTLPRFPLFPGSHLFQYGSLLTHLGKIKAPQTPIFVPGPFGLALVLATRTATRLGINRLLYLSWAPLSSISSL